MKYYGKTKTTIEKMLSMLCTISSEKRYDTVWYLYENITTTIIGDDYIAKSISIRIGDECDFIDFGAISMEECDEVKFQVIRHTLNEMKTKIFILSIEEMVKIYDSVLDNFDVTTVVNYFRIWDTKYKNISDIEESYVNNKTNTLIHMKSKEHNSMIDSVSYKIMSSGFETYRNKDIDLMYKSNEYVIMEFKTITKDNEYKQISKAIQQLEYYEFKHFISDMCRKIIIVNNIINHKELKSYCEYKNIEIYYYNYVDGLVVSLDTNNIVEFN